MNECVIATVPLADKALEQLCIKRKKEGLDQAIPSKQAQGLMALVFRRNRERPGPFGRLSFVLDPAFPCPGPN